MQMPLARGTGWTIAKAEVSIKESQLHTHALGRFFLSRYVLAGLSKPGRDSREKISGKLGSAGLR